MPTPCPCGQWLRQHRGGLVNDYFSTCPRRKLQRRHGVCVFEDFIDTVSAKSNTMLTLCQRSQWLCGHKFSANIFACSSGAQVKNWFLRVSKISWHCPFNENSKIGSRADPKVRLQVSQKIQSSCSRLRKYTIFKGQWHTIFYPYFVYQKTRPGPHLTRLKWFCEFFVFPV